MTDRRLPHPTARAVASPSWYRRQVEGTLRSLRDARLTVVEGGTATQFGADDAEFKVTIEVHDPRFWRRLCWGGDLGAAEALLDGDWSCDDLTQLVRIAIRNASVSGERSALVGRLLHGLARARHWLRTNTRRGARRT